MDITEFKKFKVAKEWIGVGEIWCFTNYSDGTFLKFYNLVQMNSKSVTPSRVAVVKVWIYQRKIH